mmetsp:Transcript_16311/g.51153  ORF Transcript_16311/g.51153 Transcript_16311/m.51153 type:complete len:98 (-) Transcript_16311:35-328(-)
MTSLHFFSLAAPRLPPPRPHSSLLSHPLLLIAPSRPPYASARSIPLFRERRDSSPVAAHLCIDSAPGTGANYHHRQSTALVSAPLLRAPAASLLERN